MKLDKEQKRILKAIWPICLALSVVQRKRYPLEDPDLDKQVTHNFKEGIKGSGITFLIIGIGFRRGDSFQRRKVSRISL